MSVKQDRTYARTAQDIERKYSFKSGVNIMFGCNNFCTYCIIPKLRGRYRSRKPDAVLAEAQKLAKEGYIVTIIGWDRDTNHPLVKGKVNLSGHSVDVVRFGIKAQFGGGIKKNLINI